MTTNDKNTTGGAIVLSLIGPFEAHLDDGSTLVIKEKKARALLAMVLVAPKGKRSRQWLQQKLWSGRGEKEGAASLRQTLAGLRRALAPNEGILTADRFEVGLQMDRVLADTNNLTALLQGNPAIAESDFLEGLDIPDPEFEGWLTEQRTFWRTQIDRISQDTGPQAVADDMAAGQFQPSKSVPYLAVKPFSISPTAPVPSHLAEGIADQLIDQMSRVRWVATISRGTLFSADHPKLSAIAFGNQTGADFVVTGSIGANDGGIEVDIELIQLPAAIVVWRSKFTLSAPATMAQVSDIAIEIAGNLVTTMSHVHEQIAQTRGSESDAVSDLIWRGRWHMHRLNADGFSAAKECFERVIDQDPSNPDAHLYKALTTLWKIWTQRGSREQLLQVRKQAQYAVTLDVSDGRGYWIVGTAETWLRNFDASERYIDEAIRLCPSLAFAYVQRGTLYAYTGRPNEAIEQLEHALRLSPFDQQKFNFLGEIAMSALLAGDHHRAQDTALQALLLRPSYWYAHMINSLAHFRSGNMEAARKATETLLVHRPDFSPGFIRWLPFADATLGEKMITELELITGSLEDLAIK